MEFLDPVAKKRRGQRLMIGYFLTGVLILTAATIITYWSYGFNVDRKTGEVIQNGLIYIDSAPDNARITLLSSAGTQRATTNTKMILAEGEYTLTIAKDGYRDWSRQLLVKGGSIQRITYPLLVQSTMKEDQVADLGQARPQVMTQSPDRKWLLVSRPGSFKQYAQFDLGNVAADTISPAQTVITFPDGVFKTPDGQAKLEVVEWSTDNKHFVAKYTYGTGYEYLILNRDQPEKSISLNQVLGVNPVEVSLRDKQTNQLYLFDPVSGFLQLADVNSKVITPILNSVTAYKTHGEDVIIYSQKISDNSQNVYIKDSEQTYQLSTLPLGKTLLDVARFQKNWFYIVGSDAEKKTYVYKNPVEKLRSSPSVRIAPLSVLRTIENLERISFSTNTRFVMAHGGKTIGIYDVEMDEVHKILLNELPDPATKPSWMDGHRVVLHSGGNVRIFDFDGSNSQQLVAASGDESIYFDRDYTVIYTIRKSDQSADSFKLYSTDIRAEADK